MPSMERISTLDNATTNNSIPITNNPSQSIIGSLSADEGKTSRHLRPRYHMDNLSKYNSKKYKYLIDTDIYILFAEFYI